MKKIVKKTIAKKKPSKNSKEDRMMVLLEDMRGEIKAVAEGHSELKNSIVDLRTEMMGKFAAVDNNFKLVRERFATMDDNFKLVFEHFSNIEDEIMEIKSEIKDIRRGLEKKADIDRLDILERRVAELEKRQLILKDANRKKYKA